MVELRMTNGDVIHCPKDVTLDEIIEKLKETPVFLQVSPKCYVRAEDISTFREVKNDEN